MKTLNLECLEKFLEFDKHELVVEVKDDEVGLMGYIAIHHQRGDFPSLGATRLWSYESAEEALKDSLRLSRLMSFKSALSGLPFGGAKATLVLPAGGIKDRKKYFESYVQKVNELGGKFVTGTDVGVSNDDLDIMRSKSEYIIGTGVNSGYYTAVGVKYCIESVMSFIFGTKSLQERSFAVQGVGKTGYELVRLLAQEGVKNIFISDVDQTKIDKLVAEFPFLKVVDCREIHKQQVDVFSPSALSGVLNKNSIQGLNCKAVVGSANNQLADSEIAEALQTKGIIYVPDYLANSGGIVSVVDQYQFGFINNERVIEEIKKIPKNLDMILVASKKTGLSLEKEAFAIANEVLSK